jgi:hypothetical protein
MGPRVRKLQYYKLLPNRVTKWTSTLPHFHCEESWRNLSQMKSNQSST